jgi:hypothetical protein
MKIELHKWDNKNDNNNGYIYGIYYLDNDEVVEVEWYKTEQERQETIKKEGLKL